MKSWGYLPIVAPLLEYSEVFTRAQVDSAEEEASFRLIDRETGRRLTLRADFTPQVARIAATRFREQSPPFRLCYEGSVLRHVQAQRGQSRELHQAGAEIMGVDGLEADAEAMALAVACLDGCGIDGFRIDVGQVEFFRGIIEGAGLAPEALATLKSAVARKDVSELEKLLEILPLRDSTKTLLSELPLLAGGREVLDSASLLAESDHSKNALEDLSKVIELADAYGLSDYITIDLGELRGIDYHTGIIFEAFAQHMGTALCRGGRYDKLLEKYGRTLSATGFSMDLFALADALRLHPETKSKTTPNGVLIVGSKSDHSCALNAAAFLRNAGIRAALEIVNNREAKATALHAKEQQYAWMARIEQKPSRHIQLVHLESEREARLSLDEIINHIKSES